MGWGFLKINYEEIGENYIMKSFLIFILFNMSFLTFKD
jgi:hypothetical protein